MVGQGVTEKALSDGHKVIALDMGPTSLRSHNSEQKAWNDGQQGKEGNYKYHQLDATDYESYYNIVKEEGCTAIIHLAATFNKFGEDGELTSNVHSHVSLHFIPYPLEYNLPSYRTGDSGDEDISYSKQVGSVLMIDRLQ
jgi:hypothetical protein